MIPNAHLSEAECGGHPLVGHADVVKDQVNRFVGEHQ